jgi:hypothetical protein
VALFTLNIEVLGSTLFNALNELPKYTDLLAMMFLTGLVAMMTCGFTSKEQLTLPMQT